MKTCEQPPLLVTKGDDTAFLQAWEQRYGSGTVHVTKPVPFGENVENIARVLPGSGRVFSLGGDGMASLVVNAAMALPEDRRPPIGFLPNGNMNNMARWANCYASRGEYVTSPVTDSVYPLKLSFVDGKTREELLVRYALFYASRHLTAVIAALADAPDVRKTRGLVDRLFQGDIGRVIHGIGMAAVYYGGGLVTGTLPHGPEHDIYLNGPEMSRLQATKDFLGDPRRLMHCEYNLADPRVLIRELGKALWRGIDGPLIEQDAHVVPACQQETVQVDGEIVYINGTPALLGGKNASPHAVYVDSDGPVAWEIKKAPEQGPLWVVRGSGLSRR